MDDDDAKIKMPVINKQPQKTDATTPQPLAHHLTPNLASGWFRKLA